VSFAEIGSGMRTSHRFAVPRGGIAPISQASNPTISTTITVPTIARHQEVRCRASSPRRFGPRLSMRGADATSCASEGQHESVKDARR